MYETVLDKFSENRSLNGEKLEFKTFGQYLENKNRAQYFHHQITKP